jgi:3-oxoacyl-ACP reductase-like protein
MSGAGASAAIPTTSTAIPLITSAPAAIVTTAPPAVSQPPLTTVSTDALNALTAAVYGLRCQVGDLTTRVATVES